MLHIQTSSIVTIVGLTFSSVAFGQGAILMHGAGIWSNYTNVPSVVWVNPAANQEAADDFNAVGSVTRVVVNADSCFQCAPAAIAGVWVRFYAWQNGTPGALQYQAFVAAGSPALLYNPAYLTNVDVSLPTPFAATGQHFVSVQVSFVVAGYWNVSIANFNSPAGSSIRFRDNLAGGAWAAYTPPFGSPVNADLGLELWGFPSNPPPQPVDPCGNWSSHSPGAPAGSNTSGVRDLKVVAPDDVWAVGGSFNGPIGATTNTNVTWHWDGAHWTEIPVPSPAVAPGFINCSLDTVDASGPNDVFAAGYQTISIAGGWTGQQIAVLHWNGSHWTVFPNTPLPPSSVGGGVTGARVDDVDVRTPNDVWFAGLWIDYNPSTSLTTQPGLLMHYDGTNFSQTNVPLVVSGNQGQWFSKVEAITANDVWAAGHRYGLSTPLVPVGMPLVFHWNGSQWSSVGVPVPGTPSIVEDIDALDSNNVWLIGAYTPPTGTATPFMDYWNGSTWTSLPAPPSGGHLKVFAANDIYAAGSSVWHFDGAAWTEVQSFTSVSYPSFNAIDGLAPCQLWGAGAQTIIGQQVPFAARQDSGIYWRTQTRVGCAQGSTPGSLVALTPPKLGSVFWAGASDPSGAIPNSLPGLSYWGASATAISIGGCGVTVPGTGALGGNGELFIDPSSLLVMFGPVPWNGGASVALHPVFLPNVPALLGVTAYTQAALFDSSNPSRVILTNGLEVRLGY